MGQELPVTSYALLGLLTLGEEALTGYELKQRAESTLRFYWVAPAMSQIYAELARLRDRELVSAHTDSASGRDVTSYVITDRGREALSEWMGGTPVGFPMLKHTVCLRLLMGHAGDPAQIRQMLADYVEECAAARADLTEVREALRGYDEPGEALFHPSLVADWGLDYFEAEARHAQRALARLSGASDSHSPEAQP